MKPTRYNLQITFGGDSSEAPDNWEMDALAEINRMVKEGYSSGEILVYSPSAEASFRTFWEMTAEDE